MRRIFEEKAKPLPITEDMVVRAFQKVNSKGGGAGIDNISLSVYKSDLSNNLYKLWNRQSSGSYFPPAVKESEIDKSDGKKRKLGIPTVEDRIAQQVIKDYLEPRFERIFHDNSYGYRPHRSAHQALTRVGENVRRYAWVIDLDIKSFFDTVSHEKLLLALDKHVPEKWVKMYITRWLEAPIAHAEGSISYRSGQGTPQGGVISPLLANLYLHYAFDKWMDIHFPDLCFVRYADDIIIHCKTEKQSHYVLDKVRERFNACNLTVHPDKTKIVYCKDYRRAALKGQSTTFDFLGFSYRPMSKKSHRGGMYLGYDCAMSKKSYSKIVGEIRATKFDRWAKSWADIASLLNAKIRGWIHYYDKYRRNTLTSVFHRFHNRLAKWILNRYKRFKKSTERAYEHLRYIRRHYPTLFYHWELGYPIV
jgi:group II intron reverse transcriptase/maturase